METTTPTCQHCENEVHWSSKPADVNWGAFVHADNRTTCPTEEES